MKKHLERIITEINATPFVQTNSTKGGRPSLHDVEDGGPPGDRKKTRERSENNYLKSIVFDCIFISKTFLKGIFMKNEQLFLENRYLEKKNASK